MSAAHQTEPTPARRNIEIKARVDSLEHVRQVAAKVATEHLGVLQQTDTFFACSSGRLKVRQFADGTAELIAYDRADTEQPKASDYHLVHVHDPVALIVALTSSLGVSHVVRKRREVFLYHNVRIHLDQVDGLGEFLELESVVADEVDEVTARNRLNELMTLLNVQPGDLLTSAYADMLAAAE